MIASTTKRQKNVGPRSGQRIPVKVTSEEKERIEHTARQVRLPASRFLRELGLGYNPPSKVDLESLYWLGRLRGDLGRLGGLLKLWLVETPGKGISETEIKVTLNTIMEKQAELSELIVSFEAAIGQ